MGISKRILATVLVLAIAVAFTSGPAFAASNATGLWVSVALTPGLDLHDQLVSGRVDWLLAGATLFTETDAAIALVGQSDVAQVYVTGNGDAKTFRSTYADPATSILTTADLTVRVSIPDEHGTSAIIADGPYTPAASALWAAHSEETAGLQAQIDALRAAIQALGGTVVP